MDFMAGLVGALMSDAELEIIKGRGFYISYNGQPSVSGGWGSDTGGAETALVREEKGERVFRILNGDWRKQYKKAAPRGFRACLAIYENNKAIHGSSWTSDGR